MKRLFVALLMLSPLLAMATEHPVGEFVKQTKSVGEYKLVAGDCERFSELVWAAATSRDAGTELITQLGSFMQPKELNKPAYRALLPTLILVVGNLYDHPDVKPAEVQQRNYTACMKNVGESLPYYM